MRKFEGFMKGVNLGGWFSQCDYTPEHLDSFIKDSDFAQIAAWGFDHIRIPFDYNILELGAGEWIESGFQRIADAITAARKYNLNVLLDLHKTAGFSFDTYSENESGFFESEKYQARFCTLWEELAKRFGNDPEHVAFELLNEITDKEFLPAWNKIVRRVIAGIRQYAPDVRILVGSYHNNAATAVKDLEAPYDDKIVYNMHCYEPLLFTHQGAHWTDQIDPEKRMPITESETSEEYFEELFSGAIAKAEEYNVPLYCGEYGVIWYVSPEDTLAWYKIIHKVMERHGIGRALWTYQGMHFGLTESALDGVRADIIANA